MTSTTHRCLRYGAYGAALGLAAAAWAQDPTTALEGAGDVSVGALLELARVVGLPGVLAFLGFKAGRLIERIALQVRLHDDDRRWIEGLIDRRCNDDPDT